MPRLLLGGIIRDVFRDGTVGVGGFIFGSVGLVQLRIEVGVLSESMELGVQAVLTCLHVYSLHLVPEFLHVTVHLGLAFLHGYVDTDPTLSHFLNFFLILLLNVLDLSLSNLIVPTTTPPRVLGRPVSRVQIHLEAGVLSHLVAGPDQRKLLSNLPLFGDFPILGLLADCLLNVGLIVGSPFCLVKW